MITTAVRRNMTAAESLSSSISSHSAKTAVWCAENRSSAAAMLTGGEKSRRPSKWEATSGRVNCTGRLGGRPAPQRTAGHRGRSRRCAAAPSHGPPAQQGGARSATRYTRIGRSPWRWSANSTSGGPSVSWTAATLVPIASTAKITRPPKTSVKYPRSAATSRLGVYTKSSCWKGAGWSVTARPGDRARVPA